MKNSWGQTLASPVDYAQRPALKEVLLAALRRAFGSLRLDLGSAPALLARVAAWPGSIQALERDLGDGLRQVLPPSALQSAIETRSHTIAEEVRPYVRGRSLVDIGCGNGQVAAQVSVGMPEVLLIDVVNYVSPSLSLPYRAYSEGANLPIEKVFDTVLLLTVLHHSSDPVFLLEEAWKWTADRLIIIESVVGYDRVSREHRDLAGLGSDDQVGYAVFIDWFYNRVLHVAIPVPYNFTDPDRWRQLFAEKGMPLYHTADLGADIDVAPEHHYLFVLQKLD